MKLRHAQSAVVTLSFVAVLSVAGSGDAPASALTSTVTIPISGIVDGQPESVSLSGNLQIENTLVQDATLTALKERLTFKLVKVSGVGMTSGQTYIATGEDRLLRLLTLSDHLDLVFPLYRQSDGPRSARTAMASITLRFDLHTGVVTGATATFASPKLPS
jgi:hypothetical protein